MNINKIIRESIQKVLLKESFASDEVRRAVEEHGGVDQKAVDNLPVNGMFISDAVHVYRTIKPGDLDDLFYFLFQCTGNEIENDKVFIPCKDGYLLVCLTKNYYLDTCEFDKERSKNLNKLNDRSLNADNNVEQVDGRFYPDSLPHILPHTRGLRRYNWKYDISDKNAIVNRFHRDFKNKERKRRASDLAKEKNK